MPASPLIAGELNTLLGDLVNDDYARESVESKMVAAMEARAEFGCTDREPLVFLEQILTEVFGD